MLVQLRSRLTPYNGRDPRERGLQYVVSRIRLCFPGASGGWARWYYMYAVPARLEGFFFSGSGRSRRRGVCQELRTWNGGRRVVRERGWYEGLSPVRIAICLRGSLSKTIARPQTVLNALGLECVSVLFARAGKRDRACVGEGNSEACEAAVVWMWTVMRWPRPLAVSPLLAGASWLEPDLVVKREMLLCTGGHTHQSTQGDNTGIARRRWS